MDRGQIIESGSHVQLMQKEGLYHKLYTLKSLQTNKEIELNTDLLPN